MSEPHPDRAAEAVNDAALVARCRQGDGSAWRELVQRYQRLVYAVARRAGLDEHSAADVFQAVFSRLVQALPRIEQPDRLRAWIVTSAKNEALQHLRRGRRTVSLTLASDDGQDSAVDAIADESPLPEQLLDDLQQLHLLRLAMARLDARCHGLLTLLFADEAERLPYDAVSQQLGMPAGSIGPTRARCIAKLRGLLRALEGGAA